MNEKTINQAPSVLIHELKVLLAEQLDLELAILIGSQAIGNATLFSDWDIAIRWQKKVGPLKQLGQTETLRRLIANHLGLPEEKIDLVDLTTAGLTMKAVVAEQGLILKGEETLAWCYFLQRTWRELETFYWNKNYAT